MAALRRGIPHYQEGTENTLSAQPPVQTQRSLVPAPQLGLAPKQGVPVAAPAPTAWQAPAAPPVPIESAPPPGPPSGFGQLLRGLTNKPDASSQLTAAQQNLESSPATSAVAGFVDYLSRHDRVNNLGAAPTAIEKFINLFAGNPASTAAIAQREQAAGALSHPLVQQHLMNNPDHLAAAERDPLGYAQRTQDPEFQKIMQHSVQTHNDIKTNGVGHTDEYGSFAKVPVDPAGVAKIVTTTGATPAQAHGALEPHQYSRDEFIRVMSGMPMKTVQMLFGAQLGHITTPQESLARTYVSKLYSGYAEAKAAREALEAQGQKTKNTAAYKAAQKLENQRMQAIMDAGAPVTGAEQKPYPLPPDQH